MRPTALSVRVLRQNYLSIYLSRERLCAARWVPGTGRKILPGTLAGTVQYSSSATVRGSGTRYPGR